MKLNFFLLLLTFLAAVTLTSALDSDSGSDEVNSPKRVTVMVGSRSATVVVENNSSCGFARIGEDLIHGTWTKFPPEYIKSSDKAQWKTESIGLMTGTEASVNYECNGNLLGFYWSVPFVGANNYNARCPDNLACGWRVEGNEYDPIVTFIVFDRK